MGHNRSGTRRKQRLRRQRKEATRLARKAATGQLKPPPAKG